jgi:plastocyanin
VARKHLALLLVIVPLVLAACGDDDEETTSDSSDTTAAESTTEETTTADDAAGSGGGETIAIKESDFKLDPADVTAAAGEVTFDLSNDGAAPHNLEVEGNGVEEVSETLDPGATGSLTVDLEPGTYELYCAIGDHRDLGMEGELTVE